MTPVYVSPFLGAGADWLALLHEDLVPLVSWMGGKRRLAGAILSLLGLSPGRPIPAVLGDASWWGWVWPLCLSAETGPLISERLRSWRGEDPRALWFRLRDAGPVGEPWEQAAALLWLQARAASGVPVWWKGHLVSMDGHGRGPYPAWQATCQPKLLQHVTETRLDDAGQRNATEPRLIATTRGNGQAPGAPYAAGHKGKDVSGSVGILDPGTIARRLDSIRWHADRVPWEVHHLDAAELTAQFAPLLGPRARVYLDPPYKGCTGYPATMGRDQVLLLAETWARYRAPIVVSEAVSLASDLGSGWKDRCLRRGPKEEWVTYWGCEAFTRPSLWTT